MNDSRRNRRTAMPIPWQPIDQRRAASAHAGQVLLDRRRIDADVTFL